ncbi:MAG: hypothetical protein ACRED8_08155 [Caulobacteraceae bacterium]
MLRETTTVAFALHIGGGAIGLLSGTISIFASKGGRLHRSAGKTFFVSMLVMAFFAMWLSLAVPGAIVNLFIGGMVFYLVATAWMTVRRKARSVGLAEKIALGLILLLCAPFLILSVELATGLPPFFKSALPLDGPVLIAIYGFTVVVTIAAAADAKVVPAGGISGASRIARHLWRMCLALTLATGSAFTNGFARLLHGPMRDSNLLLLPQLVPLGLLFFWMVRVRLEKRFAAQSLA